MGLGMGFRLGLKHAGRLHTVFHHRRIFLLHVSQKWLKQSRDLVLWRRDGLQHAEDIRRQQAEYWWTWVWQQGGLSATHIWRLGPEYSFCSCDHACMQFVCLYVWLCVCVSECFFNQTCACGCASLQKWLPALQSKACLAVAGKSAYNTSSSSR